MNESSFFARFRWRLLLLNAIAAQTSTGQRWLDEQLERRTLGFDGPVGC